MEKISRKAFADLATKNHRQSKVPINGMPTSVYFDGTFFTVNDPSTQLRQACKSWGINVCESLHPDDFKIRKNFTAQAQQGINLRDALKEAFPEIELPPR